jgi:hypothetical protein
VVAKAALYTASNMDCVLCTAATATYVITTPASTLDNTIVVKNQPASTHNVTVTPASGTIEGAATASVPPGNSITCVADGTNWEII